MTTRISQLYLFDPALGNSIIVRPADDESIDIDRETGWFRLSVGEDVVTYINPQYVVLYNPLITPPHISISGLPLFDKLNKPETDGGW